jgi:hypothetical protein
MAKITHRYDLPDYAAFMNMGFELKLPDDVIKSVSDLADLVGAPTYIKTPVFPVREPGDFRSASASASVITCTNGYHVAGSSANTFQSRFGSSASSGAGGGGGGGGSNSITRASMSSGGFCGGQSATSSRNHQIPNSEWDTILAFQKTELKKSTNYSKRRPMIHLMNTIRLRS